MPRLNDRKSPRIATCLNLSLRCRANLESCIGHGNIKTLTDAVEAAAELLALRVKPKSPKRSSPKPPQDPS